MTNPSKRRGDEAELEVQAILREHLGVNARRMLGAGRKDDMGDISGVKIGGDSCVVQVVNYQNVATAVREKPLEAERQRENAGAGFACTFVRLRGVQGLPADRFRVVLTVEQWCKLVREAM